MSRWGGAVFYLLFSCVRGTCTSVIPIRHLCRFRNRSRRTGLFLILGGLVFWLSQILSPRKMGFRHQMGELGRFKVNQRYQIRETGVPEPSILCLMCLPAFLIFPCGSTEFGACYFYYSKQLPMQARCSSCKQAECGWMCLLTHHIKLTYAFAQFGSNKITR